MFELVKALEDGADELKTRRPNPISVSAGCELFIAFVTLFPHESEVRAMPYEHCYELRPAVPGLFGAQEGTHQAGTDLCQRSAQLPR
jgi:hypothetical protein